VNPFQVKEVYFDGSLLEGEGINFSQAILDTATAPENVWRDTVFVPDGGFTRIYQRFGGGDIAWTGKTVFHCHFLGHEDQGMISAILIGDPNLVATDSPTASPPTASPPMLEYVMSVISH
jgi:FtsP/CotA-like multicopper oxidase with cupredoxin domain